MKVEFEMNEQILINAIDAINCYLEMCDSPVIMCQGLTAEDKDELGGGLDLAIALIGDELHKAIMTQTKDEDYKRRYKNI